jgi:nicotinate-nucleotide adenylyltransferase
MRLAILGGSFNPVHNGHLFLAQSVLDRFDYDKILFIPAFIPPHKQMIADVTAEQRLDMLRLGIVNNNKFEVDCCELERKGVSYTSVTISYLEKKYEGRLEGKIGLIIGDDLAEGFSSWRYPDILAENTDIILARRLFSENSCSVPFLYPHKELHNALLPISSTQIRESIGKNDSWRYLVPDAVYEYIVSRNLYDK